MAQPTLSMTRVEILAEARDNAYRLVELLTALENRANSAWHRHILISLTLKAKEIEYFLPEME